MRNASLASCFHHTHDIQGRSSCSVGREPLRGRDARPGPVEQGANEKLRGLTVQVRSADLLNDESVRNNGVWGSSGHRVSLAQGHGAPREVLDAL